MSGQVQRSAHASSGLFVFAQRMSPRQRIGRRARTGAPGTHDPGPQAGAVVAGCRPVTCPRQSCLPLCCLCKGKVGSCHISPTLPLISVLFHPQPFHISSPVVARPLCSLCQPEIIGWLQMEVLHLSEELARAFTSLSQ